MMPEETETVQQTRAPFPWRDKRIARNNRIRKLKWRIIAFLAVLSVIVVLYPLLDMLYLFAYKGLTLISLARLTQTTTGGTGVGNAGLANAIAGSALIIGMSSLFAVPLGVLSGIYLAEFAGERDRYAGMVRFVSDVLAGVPSIILGYAGFFVFVLYFGWWFSAVAASLTLAILMLPYILRTTDVALRKVPDSIREGAYALGSSKTDMINRLNLRIALPGIVTGILLSISISVGETAPLLYTASFSNYLPSALFHSPVGYLTYVVWTYSQLPFAQANDLAYLAAFLLMLIVVLINLVARVGMRRFMKI